MARRPTRVLHIVRRFSPMIGGTERYVHDLAIAQSQRGYHVEIVTLNRDVTGVYRGKLPGVGSIEGMPITRLPGLGNRRTTVCLRPDVLLSRILRADYVHLHDIRFMTGFVAVACAVTRRPLFIHSHGLVFHTPSGMRFKRWYVRYYLGSLVRLTGARVVAGSASDHDTLTALVPSIAQRTELVPSGIPLARFLVAPREPSGEQVLAVGRVAPGKGLARLLHAMVASDDVRRRAWRLQVAGVAEQQEAERLRALIDDLHLTNRVQFSGPFEDGDLPRILSRAQLAVFPSLGEGFGLALLEAMAAGVPVLASNIEAHREVLGPGLADRLVDFDDPAGTAARIEAELDAPSNDQQALSDRLRTRARGFDIAGVLDALARLYERPRPK